MSRIFAAFIFTAVSFVAQLAASVPGVSISVTNDTKSGYEMVLCNDSGHTVSYAGYGGEGSDQPVYRLEVFQDGTWVDHSLGWCGVGMGPCELAPKSSRKFPIYDIYSVAKEGRKFRISVRFSAGTKSVWGKNGAPTVILSNEVAFIIPKKG